MEGRHNRRLAQALDVHCMSVHIDVHAAGNEAVSKQRRAEQGKGTGKGQEQTNKHCSRVKSRVIRLTAKMHFPCQRHGADRSGSAAEQSYTERGRADIELLLKKWQARNPAGTNEHMNEKDCRKTYALPISGDLTRLIKLKATVGGA